MARHEHYVAYPIQVAHDPLVNEAWLVRIRAGFKHEMRLVFEVQFPAQVLQRTK